MNASEAAYIATVLMEPDAYYQAPVRSDAFESHWAREVYEWVENRITEGKPVDLALLTQEMPEHGPETIRLVNDTPYTAANIEHYAEQITEAWRGREAQRIGHDLVGGGSPDDAMQRLASLHNEDGGSDDMRSVMGRFIDNLADRFDAVQRGESIGFPTGLTDFDQRTGGYHKGTFNVIAARPSMGKTSLVLAMQVAMAKQEIPSAICSLEQPEDELSQRLTSQVSGVPLERIHRVEVNDDEWPKIHQAVGRIKDLPIYLHDNPTMTVDDVMRYGRQIARKNGVQVLFLDYLQILAGLDKNNMNESLGEATRKLKQLARELGIAVVALSQLNRDLERRTDKRPVMADLRSSGAIEQDTDMVTFVYRESQYDPNADPTDAELIVSKNRQGRTGIVRCRFFADKMRWGDKEWRY